MACLLGPECFYPLGTRRCGVVVQLLELEKRVEHLLLWRGQWGGWRGAGGDCALVLDWKEWEWSRLGGRGSWRSSGNVVEPKADCPTWQEFKLRLRSPLRCTSSTISTFSRGGEWNNNVSLKPFIFIFILHFYIAWYFLPSLWLFWHGGILLAVASATRQVFPFLLFYCLFVWTTVILQTYYRVDL